MSRTDAHSPLWVRLARRELSRVIAHACAGGGCDLPDRPGSESSSKCHWALYYTGTNVCSCWMCHAGPQHRREMRATRHRDHSRLYTALGRWRDGDESAFDDIAPPMRRYYW